MLRRPGLLTSLLSLHLGCSEPHHRPGRAPNRTEGPATQRWSEKKLPGNVANIFKQPCDDGVVLSSPATIPCTQEAEPWILAATILGSSMAFIDGTAVNVALPVLQQDFRATVLDAQWVVESYALLLAALLLVGGSMGDRFGRRLVFCWGVGLFAAASIGCGLAETVNQLIIARAAQGVSGALFLPGSLAIISESFDEERRGRALGTWAAVTANSAGIRSGIRRRLL